jgi:hypothetical protein
MRIIRALLLGSVLLTVTACTTVDVTKTAKGYHEPTDPNEIEILTTIPNRPYVELATVSTNGHSPSAEAKMHNALRAKTAPLGANAVILQNTGINQNGQLWARGTAIRFQ